MDHHALKLWYERHGRRELPWRRTDDPYAIYISEVMLQQTQVATVLSRYYFPFLEAFPSLSALADAPLEQVLKCWEGLGYYSRERNLHKAAQIAAPALPDSVEALLALPGIGRNTAHAIAAFAYHQPVPVMEANVKRVLHRLAAEPVMSEKALWDYAAQCVDHTDPFSYNQAMMDIGATICTPTRPQCLVCPLASYCKGKDQPEAYPAKKVKKAVPVRPRVIVVFAHAGRYVLMPRKTRFLGGLYGFMEYEPEATLELAGVGFARDAMQHLGGIEQRYSHFTLQADVYLCSIEDASLVPEDYWIERAAIDALPISKADEKVVRLLDGADYSRTARTVPMPMEVSSSSGK